MKPGIFFAAIVATFVVGFAVGRVSAPGGASSPVPSPPVAAPSGALPPMMNEPMDSPPTSGLSGTVAEVIQVPNYTYLRLRTESGETWAAVSSTQGVREGDVVRVGAATQMTAFTSKTLGRTFDSIWFGQLEGGGGAPSGGSAEGMPPGHPSVAPGPSAAAGAVAAVAQAGGALPLRVADVFSEKDLLSGKRVRLQGVAAKVTSVQGQYYVHLKDGSGAPGKDDDLVVITGSEVKADQRVILEGKVALNKDVGMGAPYPVVVENATVMGN